jgi:tetratricopeptide (TPR) repeat protein
MEALLAFDRAGDHEASRVAYAAMLRKWPDDLPAAIGLANQLHELKHYTEAADVLREALRRHPQSVIAMNNLAQTLSDQGLQREALSQIDKALGQPSAFESEAKATRELILSRMKP